MHTSSSKAGRFKTILLATLIAGILDIIAAFAYYAWILHKTTPTKILQSIASGIFGKGAYEGGTAMALTGLTLHFIIAFIFSAFYFLIFPHISFLKKSISLSALLYGFFVWLVMNIIVLPFVFKRAPIFTLDSILPGIIILILAIGLPVSFITHIFYDRKNKSV